MNSFDPIAITSQDIIGVQGVARERVDSREEQVIRILDGCSHDRGKTNNEV